MAEHPILFSGPMVRAILEVSKTQTRLVMKPQFGALDQIGAPVRCPYGAPGDLLWVRESHCFVADGPFMVRPGVRYAADGAVVWRDSLPNGVTVYNADKPEIHKFRPSIHMPRWASRLTLRITDVRVQRVQSISEDDCIAEGIDAPLTGYSADGEPPDAVYEFSRLWDTINAKRDHGWDVNPWVWAITFEEVRR